MVKLILVLCLMVASFANATDRVGVGYNFKDNLSGMDVEYHSFKVELLSRIGNVHGVGEKRSELNFLLSPNLKILQFSIFKVEVSPKLGVARKARSVSSAVISSKRYELIKTSSTNLLTGASLGVTAAIREGFNLSVRVGEVNVGNGFKGQLSLSASIDF
jgi:hypothetical protein